MKIYNIKNSKLKKEDFIKIANSYGIGIDIENTSSNCFKVKLNRLDNDKYQKLGNMYSEKLGRYNKVNAICWHGFKDFLQGIYKEDSNLRVVTAIIEYKNKDDFELKYNDTGFKNIGSMIAPRYFNDSCMCH